MKTRPHYMIFFILLFLALMTVSVAGGEFPFTAYNYYGDDTGGSWNTGFGTANTSTIAMTNGKFIPLVADLDNDTTNEIVVFNGANLRIYRYTDSSLSVIDSYTTEYDADDEKHVWIGNIDDDEFKEIVAVADDSANVTILEYNGTSFHLERQFDFAGYIIDAGQEHQSMVACSETENTCLFAHSGGTSPLGINRLSAVGFNTSGNGTVEQITSDGGNFYMYCFPRIRNIDVGNEIASDGDSYYYFTYDAHKNTGEDDIYLSISRVNESLAVLETSVSIGNSDDKTPNNDDNCDEAGSRFTSPLIFDVDGSPANGEEIVVGIGTDTTKYDVYTYTWTGTYNDRAFLSGKEGDILSNPFIADFGVGGSGQNDFCVGSYEIDDLGMNVICSDNIYGGTVYFEGTLNVQNSGSMPQFQQDYYPMMMVTETQSSNDYSEILSMYHVFTRKTAQELGVEEYNNYEIGASVIVDYENSGYSDILILSNTTFMYQDDGYANQRPYAFDYSVNPSTQSTWKVSNANGDNTSRYVEVTITPYDIESDSVSAMAMLYYGEDIQQTANWSVNSSSGSTFSFTFNISDTTFGSTLRMVAKDTGNGGNITKDLTFSVGTSGIEFGDAIQYGAYQTTTTTLEDRRKEFEERLPTVEYNNSIYNALLSFADLTGLGLTVLWLFVMVFTTVIILVNVPDKAFAIVGIAVVDTFLIILGTLLGFLPVGIVIMMSVIFITVLGLFIWKRFFP